MAVFEEQTEEAKSTGTRHPASSDVKKISRTRCQFEESTKQAECRQLCNCHTAIPNPAAAGGGEAATPGCAATTPPNGVNAEKGGTRPWHVRASTHALSIVNPIRAIMDAIKAVPCSSKELISLGQGDPTIFGNLPPPPEAVAAVVKAVQSGAFNGYPHSAGLPACRAAIACHLDALNARHLAPNPTLTRSSHDTSAPALLPPQPPPVPRLSEDDIFVTVGASQALHICIASLANPRKNILLPRPGFPLYGMLCAYEGLEARYYDLRPEERWEANVSQIEALADEDTVAILVCNPSNPCGAVYSREHLRALVDVAERSRLVMIADEIYADMVFTGAGEFVPMAVAAGGRVPVLSTGGISKQWLVPGWRLGWAAIFDPLQLLGPALVREAMMRLMQMTTGTSSIVQAAVPAILERTPTEFFERTGRELETSAELCMSRVASIPGLSCPGPPQGTMYIMVKIEIESFPGLRDDVHFAEQLLQEEAVIILPGAAFGLENWFRIVFAAPVPTLNRAWDRIEIFCARCYGKTSLERTVA